MTASPVIVAASHLEPDTGRLQLAQIATDGRDLVQVGECTLVDGPFAPADLSQIEDQTVHGLARMGPCAVCAVDVGTPAVIGQVLDCDVVSDLGVVPQLGDVAHGLRGFYAHAVARRARVDAPVVFIVLETTAQLIWCDPRIDDPAADGAVVVMDAGPMPACASQDGGEVVEAAVLDVLADPYFARPAPKFWPTGETLPALENVTERDRAMTQRAVLAAMIARGFDHLPSAPKRVFVVGDLRDDDVLGDMLGALLPDAPRQVDDLYIPGTCFMAQAMAFQGLRALRGLPTSSPGTNGLPAAMSSASIWRRETD